MTPAAAAGPGATAAAVAAAAGVPAQELSPRMLELLNELEQLSADGDPGAEELQLLIRTLSQQLLQKSAGVVKPSLSAAASESVTVAATAAGAAAPVMLEREAPWAGTAIGVLLLALMSISAACVSVMVVLALKALSVHASGAVQGGLVDSSSSNLSSDVQARNRSRSRNQLRPSSRSYTGQDLAVNKPPLGAAAVADLSTVVASGLASDTAALAASIAAAAAAASTKAAAAADEAEAEGGGGSLGGVEMELGMRRGSAEAMAVAAAVAAAVSMTPGPEAAAAQAVLPDAGKQTGMDLSDDGQGGKDDGDGLEQVQQGEPEGDGVQGGTQEQQDSSALGEGEVELAAEALEDQEQSTAEQVAAEVSDRTQDAESSDVGASTSGGPGVDQGSPPLLPPMPPQQQQQQQERTQQQQQQTNIQLQQLMPDPWVGYVAAVMAARAAGGGGAAAPPPAEAEATGSTGTLINTDAVFEMFQGHGWEGSWPATAGPLSRVGRALETGAEADLVGICRNEAQREEVDAGASSEEQSGQLQQEALAGEVAVTPTTIPTGDDWGTVVGSSWEESEPAAEGGVYQEECLKPQHSRAEPSTPLVGEHAECVAGDLAGSRTDSSSKGYEAIQQGEQEQEQQQQDGSQQHESEQLSIPKEEPQDQVEVAEAEQQLEARLQTSQAEQNTDEVQLQEGLEQQPRVGCEDAEQQLCNEQEQQRDQGLDNQLKHLQELRSSSERVAALSSLAQQVQEGDLELEEFGEVLRVWGPWLEPQDGSSLLGLLSER